MTQNPCLPPSPTWSTTRPSRPHIVPVEELLGIARQAVGTPPTRRCRPPGEAVAEPLDTASERLWRAWSVAGHLNAVVNTPELREAYNAALPLVTEFSTWVGLRGACTSNTSAWPPRRTSPPDAGAPPHRRDGAARLPAERRRAAGRRPRALRRHFRPRAQASQKFSENVLDAIDAWSLFVEDEARPGRHPGRRCRPPPAPPPRKTASRAGS